MNRNLALTLAALALAACSPEFDPASKVDKLRVLAIRAEPPEIEPAGAGTVTVDRAVLTSLVLRADLDPDAPRTTTVVHLACVPAPGDPAPTPCVLLANLRDPAAAIAEGARQACGGGAGSGDAPWPAIDLAGVEVCEGSACGPATVAGSPLPPPALVVPSAVGGRFDALPAGAPDRILGVQAVVLAFALDATPDELVAGAGAACPAGDVAGNLARLWPSREHVLATKRVTIRGPDAPDPPNANPSIEGIRAAGTLLDAALATTVSAGTILLEPSLPATADHQLYTELDAAGVPIESTREEWVYSWFSTAGELEELHTGEGEADEWRVVGAPDGAPAVVAAVVRDLRGGVGWVVREVRVVR